MSQANYEPTNTSLRSGIPGLHNAVTGVSEQHSAHETEKNISQDTGKQLAAEADTINQDGSVSSAELGHKRNSFGFSEISTRQKYMLVLICLNDIATGSMTSIMAPLFPREAALKGVSLTVTGFILGSYLLAALVGCPVAGILTTRIGPKFVCAS